MASKPVPTKLKPTTTTATNDSHEASITTIKKSTCKSIQGKSTIGYEIAVNESGAVLIRLISNSGGGKFSNAWIAFTDIQHALEKWAKDFPIVALALKDVYPAHSSTNSWGFALAVLKKEGVVEPVPDNKRHYQLCDPAAFPASLEGLNTKHKSTAKRKPKAKA
jgi:hypothetical protein